MAKVRFMSKEEEQFLRDGWNQGPFPLPKELQDEQIARMRGGNDKELKKQAGFIGAEDLYSSNGDDYTIDDNAFSNAQMETGDNETAASVAGSSSGESGSSETNSNVNTGVFGGPARAAHPGYSLL
jgi:hypothetical protein